MMPTSTVTTFDRSGTVVSESTVEVPAEQVNQTTIEDRLRSDLDAINLILNTAGMSVTGTTVTEVRTSAQATIRDMQRQVKDLARMNKRLARLALRAFDSPD